VLSNLCPRKVSSVFDPPQAPGNRRAFWRNLLPLFAPLSVQFVSWRSRFSMMGLSVFFCAGWSSFFCSHFFTNIALTGFSAPPVPVMGTPYVQPRFYFWCPPESEVPFLTVEIFPVTFPLSESVCDLASFGPTLLCPSFFGIVWSFLQAWNLHCPGLPLFLSRGFQTSFLIKSQYFWGGCQEVPVFFFRCATRSWPRV